MAVLLKDFVGKGWKFPFRFDPATGGVARDRGTGTDQKLNRVRMSIEQIIGVKRGEIFGNRQFGSDLRGLIFQTDTANVTQRLSFVISRALQNRRHGEHRVFISRLKTRLIRNMGRAEIDLNIVLRSSNVSANFVFPFYLRDSERAAAEREVQ